MANICKAHKKRHIHDLIFCLCVMAIPTIQFAIFYVGVNFNSILMAFQKYEIDPATNLGAYKWLGFDNFESIWIELRYGSELVQALKNSAIVFLVNVGVGTTLSLVFSLYIFKRMFLSKTFRVLLFAPSILSAIVTVTMYRYFVEVALPGFIPSMNGVGLLSNLDTRMFALIFFMIWIGFGTQILMYSGAMNSIDQSVLEAAKLDGANAFVEFTRVILPLIYPTIVTFMVTNMAGFFTNQLNLFSFYGAHAETRYITLGYMLFKDTRNSSVTYAEFPKLAAYSVIFTCIATPITLLTKKFMDRIGPSTE